MLTDDEKQNIRTEEQYRGEVRKQLEEKREPSSRLWAFLNSSFGLWLLSAILLTWAGMLYTQSQNPRAEEQKKQDAQTAQLVKNEELVQRLDLEIGYRFSQSQVRLASLVRDWGGKKKHFMFRDGRGEMDVRNILDGLSQPADKKFPALFQEFSNLSIIASIVELRRHVSGKEKEELDRVLAGLSGIYIFLDVRKVPISDVRAVGGALFDGFTLPRWRAARFYFSDCPFC